MSVKDFQIIAKLGEGAYSSVYQVRRLSDNSEYALKKVKLMNLSDQEKQNALNEVRILASIRHPNIIGYKEAFLDQNSNSLCIVMEYANNGDLFQKITQSQKKGSLMNENEIWSIIIQVVKGLKALHDLKIFHRDLKSANVFLTKEGVVKLGDMNVSQVAQKGLLYTQTGTPYYASPEVWKDQPYDSQSDIWSLGCVLYEMTTLKPPFRAEDMQGLYKKIIRGFYPKIPQQYSQDLSNIIRTLLQVAPHLRPSCEKILTLPAIVKRISETTLQQADEGTPYLLNTIRIPKNLHYLTDRLPKPNYSPLKTRKIEKQKFLQTLAGYQDLQNSEINEENYPDNGSQHSMLPKINSRKGGHSVQPSHNENRDRDYGHQGNEKESENSSLVYDGPSQVRSSSRKVLQPKNHLSSNRNLSEQPSLKNSDVEISQQYDSRKVDIHPVQKSSKANGGDIYSRYEEKEKQRDKEKEKEKYRDLEKVYEVKAPKQNQYDDLSPVRKPHHLIGKAYKPSHNLLDVEGESKQLIIKGKGQSSINNSLVDDSEYRSRNDDEKLPSLGPKHSQHSNDSKLPPINNSLNGGGGGGGVINSVQLTDKDLSQIKQISKAYQVNISNMEENQDQPKSVKRITADRKIVQSENRSLEKQKIYSQNSDSNENLNTNQDYTSVHQLQQEQKPRQVINEEQEDG